MQMDGGNALTRGNKLDVIYKGGRKEANGESCTNGSNEKGWYCLFDLFVVDAINLVYIKYGLPNSHRQWNARRGVEVPIVLKYAAQGDHEN